MSGKRGIIRNFFVAVMVIALLANIISAERNSFEVDNAFLKVSVKPGDEVSRVLGITSGLGGNFGVETNNLPGAVISENEFTIEPNIKKEIMITFNSSQKPGVYVGNVKVSDEKKNVFIPVVLEVESRDVFFDSNLDIPAEYSEISPGGKIVAQVKIFDLVSLGSTGLGTTLVELEYKILDINGNAIVSESENIVVKTQAQLTKTLSFPQDAKEGNYVITVSVKYKNSVGTSSNLFRVVEPNEEVLASDKKLILIAGSIFALFVLLIVLFVFLIRDRDKFMVELKKYNAQELRRQRELLLEQERILRKRRVPVRKIKKEVKKKIKKLKARHKKRIQEFRRLKKEGKDREMSKKLEEWKKAGYDTLNLESKLNSLSVKDMQRLINKWKSKYKVQ